MATRNLSKKYFEMRSAAKANRNLGMSARDDHDPEHGGALLKSSTDWQAVKFSLPPDWVERIESVNEDITKIQNKIKELGALHTKRLMVDFIDDNELQKEREIEAKTREITEVFHHAEAILKRFGKTVDDPNIPLAERTVRKNMQMSMAKRLQGMSMSFRNTQKQYMDRLRAQKQGSGEKVFTMLTENEKKEAQAEFVDQGFNSTQMAMVDDMEALVNERDAEITRIAQSIQELAQIFKELAVLVIDQGTILDRIDYNMENAVEHAKEGITHLEKAEENQKNALSVKCIIVLVILIIIMIGVLIWKHSGK